MNYTSYPLLSNRNKEQFLTYDAIFMKINSLSSTIQHLEILFVYMGFLIFWEIIERCPLND